MSSKAVIFDRDGTLIEDADYLSDPEGIVLFSDTSDIIRRLRKDGYIIIVITNQSGIARGLYNIEDAEKVNNELNRLLEKQGAHIDEFYICPHHPDFTGPCDCRKPGTELLKQAITAYDIDVRKSWFVGDKCSDIQCGQKEGVNTALVLTGYGQSQKERCRPDIICDSLTDFYERIH